MVGGDFVDIFKDESSLELKPLSLANTLTGVEVLVSIFWLLLLVSFNCCTVPVPVPVPV